ncbi:methyltransferase domain-containing protein [Paeniglutamicibacter antarcticus]|uniref:Methyltransferase domain-containing protein n=1 Tax=Arthrobacter terrae TaxID=2935737 RepID=A0A931G680_9MICC|nr:class I SAM-dependent methyltransferase [Arthrobacter terrae]MBG0738029.1 methyltransferase domain-containing protein [Arthrobacter terrae]
MEYQQNRDDSHQSHRSHARSDNYDQHRVLDLDAEVFSANLAAVLDRTGVRAARGVVDLGAGTGAGSRLLRGRYPDAAVTCVDNDPQMLELLREQGFAVVEADLDEGFPALVGSLSAADPTPGNLVDLVWASSSLHHVADPARLLSGIHRTLAAGGVLAVVELAALPRFLSDTKGALLEQRCHAAAAAEGWNHHPNWTSVLETAGFAVTQSEVTTTASVTPAAREYAQQWFARFCHLEALTGDDRAAVADLIEQLLDDMALEPRTTRSIWVATRK